MRQVAGQWPNEHPLCSCVDHSGLHVSLWRCEATGATWIYYYQSDQRTEVETWPSRRIDFGPFDTGAEIAQALANILSEYAQHHLA